MYNAIEKSLISSCVFFHMHVDEYYTILSKTEHLQEKMTKPSKITRFNMFFS